MSGLVTKPNCPKQTLDASKAQGLNILIRISLNWPLDAQGDLPFFGRQAFHKNVYQKPPRIVNDDVWTFNTQSSSQCKQPYNLPFPQTKPSYSHNCIQGTASATSATKKKNASTTT